MSVGINGFGRIGRILFRQLVERGIKVDFISDSNLSIDQVEILANYDSVYGRSKNKISKLDNSNLILGGKKIKFYKTNSLDNIDLKKLTLLIDCSPEPNVNLIRRLLDENKNIRNAILTHHTVYADRFFVWGVNSNKLPLRGTIISTTSCDGTAISPVLNIFSDLEINFISIIAMHPYLSSQRLLDGASQESNVSNLSLWRAAPNNLIPKETSIAKVCAELLPGLKGKIEAYQIRVPTNCVSCAFVRFFFKGDMNLAIVKKKFDKIRKLDFIKINSIDLTSIDFCAEPYSAILDDRHIVVKDNFLELLLWYDNEFGYASKVADLVCKVI